MRYRKVPLVVDAVQWTGDNAAELVEFTRKAPGDNDHRGPGSAFFIGCFDTAVVYAEKEHTDVLCPLGHWVVKGIAGEFYPCAPDVFARSYEAVEEAQ